MTDTQKPSNPTPAGTNADKSGSEIVHKGKPSVTKTAVPNPKKSGEV